MENIVLSVKNLTKLFYTLSWQKSKPFVAVDHISFDLKKGEILGFLGPNGAGKTTTIQMLLGVMTPSSGSITYFGNDFFKHRSTILQKVTFASAYTRLPSRLTIYENLDIYGRLYGLNTNERMARIKELLTFFGLWERRNQLVGPLSAGQITRVMLAKAFLPKPNIVLLDEPTASLDPDIASEVREFIIRQQKERNLSIVFTSHNMAEVEELCDRVLILKKGIIIANNTPEQIAAQISETSVTLMICDVGMDRAKTVLKHYNYVFTISENFIKINVKEDQIAFLLTLLAQHTIEYSQISIDKPTLEDYFLQVAKE